MRYGYLDVEVKARFERKGDAATVIYTIVEGVCSKTKISITGIEDAELVEKILACMPDDRPRLDHERAMAAVVRSFDRAVLEVPLRRSRSRSDKSRNTSTGTSMGTLFARLGGRRRDSTPATA